MMHFFILPQNSGEVNMLYLPVSFHLSICLSTHPLISTLFLIDNLNICPWICIRFYMHICIWDIWFEIVNWQNPLTFNGVMAVFNSHFFLPIIPLLYGMRGLIFKDI